uniref:Uncharacterized protein n=1 Tax=Arundo donax TaxID=35708 RepID=A0A0A9HTG6_ARUDO
MSNCPSVLSVEPLGTKARTLMEYWYSLHSQSK